MSEFLPAVFRPRRRLLRVISACSSASSSCSTYKISSSIMGLLNGESSRAVWLLALLGCTSASSFVSSERPVEWSYKVKSSSVNSCGSARIGCPGPYCYGFYLFSLVEAQKRRVGNESPARQRDRAGRHTATRSVNRPVAIWRPD
ncbi:hypothetical protein F2Q68_00010435 [Brassica cretica]|uniref:Uncharacterized protein n=1 Tax=Brassica cretica TaxID=69181 RepID=A0A8S9KLK6_BRACR|nr:hypothetical protein F2Q68_00010435 [Brassica cretica]